VEVVVVGDTSFHWEEDPKKKKWSFWLFLIWVLLERMEQ